MKLSLVATALLALSTSFAMGQNINHRKVDQQSRIAQGMRSGQLTGREAGNVERREGSINREEHAMRRSDGGRLTARDRATLTRRQNRVSRSIYRDKHNGHVR